jgi:signal transduction histidine kinase
LKILRAFALVDTLLLTLGFVLALRYASSHPAASLRAGIVGNPSVLSLGVAGLGVLAVVLWLTSDLPLVGNRRRLALGLSFVNLLIAALALTLPLAGWWRAVEFELGLVFLGLAAGLLRVGSRPPSPDAIAAEIAALKIPDETRQALLQQVGEAAAQEERNRLARDLHDSIKQQLFSINVGTAAAQERWDQDPEGALKTLGEVRRCAREAMVEMQAMLHQLRPEALGTAGLIEALREQCEAQGYRTGAEVTLELGEPIPDDRMPPGAEDTLFRIGQEMLANAARHARARHVRLWLGRQGDAVTLAVEDDGQGFDSTAPASGMGLCNLKERAASLGGRLEITSRPGEGTRAQVWAPLTPVAAVSARGLSEKSWSLNWNTFFMAALYLNIAPSALHPHRLMFIADFFITSILFSVAASWWDVRDTLRKFPDAAMADLASYRYAGHRARAVMSLVGAWLAYQSGHLPGGWGIASRPLSLLFLALLGVDLFGAHRWSRPNRRPLENWKWPWKSEWPHHNRKILIFFLLPLMSVCFLTVTALNYEFWAQTEQLQFIALGAAFLAYFFWRRPRLEGASS